MYWAASDVGWVVGHSYIVYGPLLVGVTTVLYEGKPVGTPDPGAFWLVAMVRSRIGPVACFRRGLVVKRLPKTRSGKILRATLREIADGADYSVPSTIDDPAILDEISDVLHS